MVGHLVWTFQLYNIYNNLYILEKYIIYTVYIHSSSKSFELINNTSHIFYDVNKGGKYKIFNSQQQQFPLIINIFRHSLTNQPNSLTTNNVNKTTT